jgi:hypothetical protein
MIEWGDNLKKHKESVILFLKVFIILFILGFIFPNILAFTFNYIIIKPEIKAPENYLFVTSHLKKSKSFYDIFIKILEKVIEF